MPTKNPPYLISIVIPVLNEEDCLDACVKALQPTLKDLKNFHSEIIFVDDGSTDNTVVQIIENAKNYDNINLIVMGRNFGKEIAVLNGLLEAKGDCAVIFDADLQDPPEVIPLFIEEWNKGYELVHGVRTKRNGDSLFQQINAWLFYKIMRIISNTKIPINSSDYKLLDKNILERLKNFKGKIIFFKALLPYLSSSQSKVLYERNPRKHGKSKWNYWKLFNFSIDGIVSFSTVPLKIWTYLGFLSAMTSMVFGGYIVFLKFNHNISVQGYTSIIVATVFMGGMSLMGLGILGEYIGRIYHQVNGIPHYFTKQKMTFSMPQAKSAKSKNTKKRF